jgi:hypothetical protein
MRAKNKPVDFTYFISGVYFLPYSQRNTYHPPRNPVGFSNIGFAINQADVDKRWLEVNGALSEGHEIGSHLVGHLKGTMWSETDWRQEFDEFKKMVPINMVGVRTPFLSRNDNLYKLLPKIGYRYDASGVGKLGQWPMKDKYGIWEVPLVIINIPGTGKSALSMDYNLFLVQSGAKESVKKGTPGWSTLYQQTLGSYLNYFNTNYNGSRAPVIIGHHFSLFNDGVYFEALKTFAEEVCGKPEVKCSTFSELVRYLDRGN